MRITQSTLGNVDKCMLSAQFTLDPPPNAGRVGGAARAVGTGYHGALEPYYVERKANPGLLPDVDMMIAAGVDVFERSLEMDLYDNTPLTEFKWDDKIPDAATGKRLIRDMVIEYVNGRHYWPLDWGVLGVEVHSTVEVPELAPHTAKFGADLVLVDPNGFVVGVDNKTAGKKWSEGKEHPRKNNQSPFYLRLMREVYPGAPGYRFVFDIMTLPSARKGPSFERRISDPQPEHEAAIMKKAADFAAIYDVVHVQMGRDLPANPASTLCNPRWCDWFHTCPHGSMLE